MRHGLWLPNSAEKSGISEANSILPYTTLYTAHLTEPRRSSGCTRCLLYAACRMCDTLLVGGLPSSYHQAFPSAHSHCRHRGQVKLRHIDVPHAEGTSDPNPTQHILLCHSVWQDDEDGQPRAVKSPKSPGSFKRAITFRKSVQGGAPLP